MAASSESLNPASNRILTRAEVKCDAQAYLESGLAAEDARDAVDWNSPIYAAAKAKYASLRARSCLNENSSSLSSGEGSGLRR